MGKMAKFLSLTLTTSEEIRPFNTYGVTNLEHTFWRIVHPCCNSWACQLAFSVRE